jgi:hypothetical protein
MKPESDDTEPPEVSEADPINGALGPLFEIVCELTESGSPQRAAAMGEVLALPARIRAAIARPRLN